MRVRPIVPGGRAGLLLLAAAAVPIVLSRSKSLSRKLGDKLVEWGEQLRREADRMESSAQAPKSSNPVVKEAAHSETHESASPTGKEEVKEQIASKTAQRKAPPKAQASQKKPVEPKDPTIPKTNPKSPGKNSASRKSDS